MSVLYEVLCVCSLVALAVASRTPWTEALGVSVTVLTSQGNHQLSWLSVGLTVVSTGAPYEGEKILCSS